MAFPRVDYTRCSPLITLILLSLATASCGLLEDSIIAVPCENAVENEWTYLGLEGESVTSIAIHPLRPNIIFAGTGYDFSAGRTGKLYRSTDCGATWTMLLQGGAFHGIMFQPDDPTTVYAFGWPAVGTPEIPSRNLIRSYDAGETWKKLLPEDYTQFSHAASLAIDPTNSGHMLVGMGYRWRGWLVRTRNGGSTWEPVRRDGDPTAGDPTLLEDITALLIHPQESQIILAGGSPSGTIYRSSDGGRNWDVAMSNYATYRRFLPDLNRPGRIWALVARMRQEWGGPLFCSEDWGQTWSSVSVIDTLHAYYDFFIDERDVFYLATNDGVLTNRTGEWGWINEGFDSMIGPAIYTARPDPTYTNMYAGKDYNEFDGVHRGGIYVRRLK